MFTRKASIEDLQDLSILFDAYRVFYKQKTDLEAARDFISQRILQKDSTIFVCCTDADAIVGFVQLYPLFSSTRMKRLWLLNDLFLHPAQRGKGLSVSLIDAAKALCTETGACGLMLETAKDNYIGNSLYVKTGFTVDNEHNYYEWNSQ